MRVEKWAAGATLERQNLKETRAGNGSPGASRLIHGLPLETGKAPPLAQEALEPSFGADLIQNRISLALCGQWKTHTRHPVLPIL